MKSTTIRIGVCSGGTGGHLFPAKALTESLVHTCVSRNNQSEHLTIDLYTDKRSLAYLDQVSPKVAIKLIKTLPFSGKSSVLKFKALMFMGWGFLQSMYLFLFKRPKLVIAFGGYVSVPVLWAAVILKIPIILHEQNAILGRANKMFTRYAKVVTTSFLDTLGLDKYVSKVRYTGLPIRKVINSSTATLAEHRKGYTIAILGGSQGARIFGDFIPKALSLLSLEEQEQLVVYHQCRPEFLNSVTAQWQTLKITAVVQPFFHNIAEVMLKSDLIISRAGASTIAEINYYGRPAIYIPFKQAILNHQLYNAQAMVKQGAAEILLEDDLNYDSFNDIILKLLHNKSKRDIMALSAKNAGKVDATHNLQSLVINWITNQHAKF